VTTEKPRGCFVCGAPITKLGNIAFPRWGMEFCSVGCRGDASFWIDLRKGEDPEAGRYARGWHGHDGGGVKDVDHLMLEERAVPCPR
jgi:hypothetical protein